MDNVQDQKTENSGSVQSTPLDLSRLFVDDVVREGVRPADSMQLEVPVYGGKLLGEIYFPDGTYEGPRPCVLIFHGFPGSVVNDDMAHAFRRMGCVVVRPFMRGGWGSRGYYSFTNNIRDAVALVRWVEEELSQQVPIDLGRLFLVGHSVGGNTVINATRQLPEIRATIAAAPMDVSSVYASDDHYLIDVLFPLAEGVLNLEYPGVLMDNLKEHWREMAFPLAAEDLRDRNLFLIGAEQDIVAPPDVMLDPFIAALRKVPTTKARRELVMINDRHSFDSTRIRLTTTCAKWIAGMC